MEEFKYNAQEFPITSAYKKYTAGDTRADDNLDNRERVVSRPYFIKIIKAKIWVHMREMGLAPLQRQRFIYLLGNRYTGSDKVKLTCR